MVGTTDWTTEGRWIREGRFGRDRFGGADVAWAPQQRVIGRVLVYASPLARGRFRGCNVLWDAQETSVSVCFFGYEYDLAAAQSGTQGFLVHQSATRGCGCDF